MAEWLIKTQYDASEMRWVWLANLIVNKWGRRRSEGNGFDPSKYKEHLDVGRLLHVMFQIDMSAYGELGYSLTGVAWKKGDGEFEGVPVPKDLDRLWEMYNEFVETQV